MTYYLSNDGTTQKRYDSEPNTEAIEAMYHKAVADGKMKDAAKYKKQYLASIGNQYK